MPSAILRVCPASAMALASLGLSARAGGLRDAPG